MLNKEKYKDELEDILAKTIAVSESGKIYRCTDRGNCKDCIFCSGACIGDARKWLNAECKGTAMLNDEEKAYLAEIIKPFRDEVTGILKGDNGNEFIRISVENDGAFRLPYFKKGSMYKNMKTNKKYKLEELGL